MLLFVLHVIRLLWLATLAEIVEVTTSLALNRVIYMYMYENVLSCFVLNTLSQVCFRCWLKELSKTHVHLNVLLSSCP